MEKLLDMLACPKCNSTLSKRGMFLLCRECGLAYPILEKDIPNMVADDAWKMGDAKKKGFKHGL